MASLNRVTSSRSYRSGDGALSRHSRRTLRAERSIFGDHRPQIETRRSPTHAMGGRCAREMLALASGPVAPWIFRFAHRPSGQTACPPVPFGGCLRLHRVAPPVPAIGPSGHTSRANTSHSARMRSTFSAMNSGKRMGLSSITPRGSPGPASRSSRPPARATARGLDWGNRNRADDAAAAPSSLGHRLTRLQRATAWAECLAFSAVPLAPPRSHVLDNLHTGSESGLLHPSHLYSLNVLPANRQSVGYLAIGVSARKHVENCLLQII